MFSRTLSGRPLISAMPPALSVTGPNESMATTMPAMESMESAATAMPKMPPKKKLASVATTMTRMGKPVASMPTGKALNDVRAWPETLASAMDSTGFFSDEV